MTLAYLLCVVVSLVVLAVALRRRPAPAPTNPLALSAEAALSAGVEADVRLILVTATQLVSQLATAA
ncbi:hypothetical protein [Streptomyces sp. NPDC057909]|uniref:hypothetical protein n=1 Tax=Streptomyces sp. NPDC057909 TaxID=3346277 RepID=UPI0036F0EA54